MKPDRSQIRKMVIRESYHLNLIQQLYEQAVPTPAVDPTAAAADPTAAATTPPADPALAGPAAPAVDPAASAMPTIDPATMAATPADPALAAAPAVDPTATAAAAVPPVPTPPAAGAAATPAPGSPAAPAAGAAPAAPGGGQKPVANAGTAAAEVDKAGQAALAAASQKMATESLRRHSLRFLMEQEAQEPSIDIGVYAGKIANLIKNYTSLVDVKKNVIDQAEKFLDDQFPKSASSLKKQLKDLLRKDYHVSLERQEEPEAPFAVGAKSGGGGAS